MSDVLLVAVANYRYCFSSHLRLCVMARSIAHNSVTTKVTIILLYTMTTQLVDKMHKLTVIAIMKNNRDYEK